MHYEVLEGNGNSERFRQFLHGVQLACNNFNLNDSVIVIDNVSFHRSAIFQEEMVVLGFELKYLPPYSPFFNPIENLFSQWKNITKRLKPTTEDELMHAMHSINDVLTEQDCANYVAKVSTNCHNCTLGQDYFNN